MTTFTNNNTNNNNGNSVQEISMYMLIDVRKQSQSYQDAFDESIQKALTALQEEVGEENWNEGAKAVLWEQLLYIAQPRDYKPNHDIRYCVEVAAIAQGDEDCGAWEKYRAWELRGVEQLEMYVHYLKGGDVIEWLRCRWERRKDEMRGEMQAWGYNFDMCPIEEDEDLIEEHRRLREWYYSDFDDYDLDN